MKATTEPNKESEERLREASPDLLKALNRLLRFVYSQGIYSENGRNAAKQAEEAIFKATNPR